MWVVDWERNNLDFGRIEIEPDPEGYWPENMLAAMKATDLEMEGCKTVVKYIKKETVRVA